MELKYLKYFVEIAEQRSMRKAADSLYVTQPNLTRAMQNLEDEMGEKLLIRSNHGVSLTTTGESLYYYAQSVLNQMREIEALKRKDKEFMQNKLAVSVGDIILKDEIMLNFYENLQTRHANISIYETSIERVLRNVSELEAEIGIISVNTKQCPALSKILDIKDLEAHEVASSPLYVHVGEANPLYGQDTVEPRELLAHTYIHLPYDYFTSINTMITLGDIKVMDFERTIVINNYHAIVNMIKRTDAFIFGGRWQVDELKKGHIDSLLVSGSEVEMRLLWVKRKKEILSAQAKDFLDIITENYGDKIS